MKFFRKTKIYKKIVAKIVPRVTNKRFSGCFDWDGRPLYQNDVIHVQGFGYRKVEYRCVTKSAEMLKFHLSFHNELPMFWTCQTLPNGFRVTKV